MSINHVTKDIEASLQRSGVLLNEDKKMQRQHLLYGDGIPRQQQKTTKESSAKSSGTFNTVRLKKYFGLGSKKKTNDNNNQSILYPPVNPRYPDVVQQYPVYPTRYPEGWMYTTVTSKTVHTVYTAMRGRGGGHGYRQRSPMYAWDYPVNPDVERELCICGVPPASSTWGRGRHGKGQCTCNEEMGVMTSSPPKGNRKWSGSSVSGKFSTVSSAATSHSGSKRKSILECDVTAYDLIARGGRGKGKDNEQRELLDDSLNENFLEEEERKDVGDKSSRRAGDGSGNLKALNLYSKGKEALTASKKAPVTSTPKSMTGEWDNYYDVDTKQMRIGGQRMLITDSATNKNTTATTSIPKKMIRELPSSTRPRPQSSLAKATTDQLVLNPPSSNSTSQSRNSGRWQIMKPATDKLKPVECPRIPRLTTERHAPTVADTRRLGTTSPAMNQRENIHLSREILFEEDENAADDEQSPVAPRSLSRSTPNLPVAVRNTTRTLVVKPILKKASSADTSSETDSDLYGSEATTSVVDRRRKKHVHFKSRGPHEPVVEEIPPLEISECSESEEEDDVKVEIRPPTPPIRSNDDDYLEPKKKPPEQPYYVNQSQETDFYDDCNQIKSDAVSAVTSTSKTESNQSRQSACLRRSQSERPRQRSPANIQEDNIPRSPPPRSNNGSIRVKMKTMKNDDQLQTYEHKEASDQLDKLIREQGSDNLLPKSVRDSLRPEENLYDDTANTEDFGLPETGKEPVDDFVDKVTDVNRKKSCWKLESNRSNSVEFITNLRNRTFAIPRPPLMKSRSVPVRSSSMRVVSVNNGGSLFNGNGEEGVAIYEQIGEPIYEELPDYPQYDNATTLALLSPPLDADPALVGDGPRRSIFEGASRNEILSILQDAKERGVEDMEVEQANTNGDQTQGLQTQVLPTQGNNRIRISNISNLSDSSHSSEDSTTTDENKVAKERRSSVEVERNDSGVGPETSKPTRLRRQSSIDPANEELSQCEDCDQNIDTKNNAGNLFEPLICKKCSKKRAERREIIAEIVETEIKYGRDLRIIRDEFSRPMAVAGLLTSDQLTSIFLNIDELIDVNAKFTEKLRDAIDITVEQGDDDYATVNIGKIFQEATPMLRAFESYCVGQGSACLLLTSLEKEKELLRIFLRVSQMENTLLRRMNLNSFLMVPVQRVTKYPLLLNRLCKVTSYQHKDRDAIKEAQQKIELHLEQINQQAKDISGTKIWRRISHISTIKKLPINEQESGGNIKLRKMAMEVLDWNADQVRFVWEGKLLFTHITDHLWNRRSRTLKMSPVYALLLTLGKPNDNYRPDKADADELLFPRNTGIREASVVLAKEKNNRQSLVREPIFLQNCVICSDCESEEMFEIQDFVNKEAYLFKAEDLRGSQEWLRQLRYHAKDLGSWRRRRNALANIMINGMVRH